MQNKLKDTQTHNKLKIIRKSSQHTCKQRNGRGTKRFTTITIDAKLTQRHKDTQINDTETQGRSINVHRGYAGIKTKGSRLSGGHDPTQQQYLARSFRSSRPSLFLSNIFIYEKKKSQSEAENSSEDHERPTPASSHHGVSVLLQLLRGHGLPVLDEEVLEEALAGGHKMDNFWTEQHQKYKIKQDQGADNHLSHLP